MIRAVQTAEPIPKAQFVRWKAMEEIDVGTCDGFTYAEFEQKYPEEFAARKADKLRYRYPGAGGGGESYQARI